MQPRVLHVARANESLRGWTPQFTRWNADRFPLPLYSTFLFDIWSTSTSTCNRKRFISTFLWNVI